MSENFRDFDNGRFYLGECLETMASFPDGIFDMVMCDLPYGTTACKWDSVIPFEPLWAAYKRICKPNAAIVLTASQPFTSLLVTSNIRAFRYQWVWHKNQGSNFALVKHQPRKTHEDIVVFSFEKHPYFPQGLRECRIEKSNKGKGGRLGHESSEHLREKYVQTKTGYPESVLDFQTQRGIHPTQKPVALMEYMIRTYTNERALVLDNCAGSGTTAVACENLNRRWVCIEREEEYFNKAVARLAKPEPDEITA